MEENTPNPTTPEESIFNEADYSTKGYEKHIRNARIILFIIGGAQLLSILTILKEPEPAFEVSVGILVFFAALFTALAFWTKKKPFTAVLIGLIVYVTLLVLSGILEPSSIAQGLLLKAVFICLLVMGLRNAKESQDLMKAFGKD